ncbi:GL25302 [Drosophila persimilis]|uniref:GL25302 n=1 Tax=Drosophila persimilis TaxID=7234 RepID=B4GS12_DROPE|nr:GL25302 [Drosophila persimilis]
MLLSTGKLQCCCRRFWDFLMAPLTPKNLRTTAMLTSIFQLAGRSAQVRTIRTIRGAAVKPHIQKLSLGYAKPYPTGHIGIPSKGEQIGNSTPAPRRMLDGPKAQCDSARFRCEHLTRIPFLMQEAI